MSRLDDLIDLIQTTNEVYFITAPGRVRTAYILVDDIVELALKTFLQEKALEQRETFEITLAGARLVTRNSHRTALKDYFEEEIELSEFIARLGLNSAQITALNGFMVALTPFSMLQHWSVNDVEKFKKYPQIITEVKLFFVAGSPILGMLDKANSRHQVRNKFYHDHRQAGLTIDDDKCLRALCSMFDLMEHLFPGSPTKDSFGYLTQRNKTVRCQTGVLRLKLASHGSNELEAPYIRALKQFNNDHKVVYEFKNFEHSVLHTISDRFFKAIRSHINAEVISLESKLVSKTDKVNRLRLETQARHRPELEDIQYQLNIMRQQLQAIDTLLATP